MKSTESINISSLRELQLQMPRIVQAVNANPKLALAAAANPLLAIEQLGYKLSPEAQKEIEQYARFGPDNLKRLAEIETEFGKLLATKTVPVNLTEARALFEKSGHAQPDKSTTEKKMTLKPTKNQGLEASLENIFASRVWSVSEEKKLLSELSARHASLPLLFEYRKIHRQRQSFATRSAFETILSGEKNTLVDKIEFKLSRHRDGTANHPTD
jgi:hypothetical protein